MVLRGSRRPSSRNIRKCTCTPFRGIRGTARRFGRLNHYFHLDRTEERLRGLLQRFRFAPVGDVLARLEADQRLPTHTLVVERAAA